MSMKATKRIWKLCSELFLSLSLSAEIYFDCFLDDFSPDSLYPIEMFDRFFDRVE